MNSEAELSGRDEIRRVMGLIDAGNQAGRVSCISKVSDWSAMGSVAGQNAHATVSAMDARNYSSLRYCQRMYAVGSRASLPGNRPPEGVMNAKTRPSPISLIGERRAWACAYQVFAQVRCL